MTQKGSERERTGNSSGVISRESESFGLRVWGAEGECHCPFRTPNDLPRNREVEGSGERLETPRGIVSAFQVNSFVGKSSSETQELPERDTLRNSLEKAAREFLTPDLTNSWDFRAFREKWPSK
jgi:hypothetical protein